jgi:hypothetical protein
LVRTRRGTTRKRFADHNSTMYHVGANAASEPPPDYGLNFTASFAAWLIGRKRLGPAIIPDQQTVERYVAEVYQPPAPTPTPVAVAPKPVSPPVVKKVTPLRPMSSYLPPAAKRPKK